MSFVKGTRPNRMQKTSKRVLIGETREEEAARLEREIAAHPVSGPNWHSITEGAMPVRSGMIQG